MKTLERERKQQLIELAIEEYLNSSDTQRSLTKIGEKYGVHRNTLSRTLKNRGYEVINYQNQTRIDENVFDEIDTEEKAYWLGFLYADGNISTTGNRLELNLSAKDLDHMLKFKEFLKFTGNIRVESNNLGRNVCRLSVRNKHLWQQLYNKGCVPCKSLILTFPDKNIFKNSELIRHFIRGYCDGDGSLGFYHRGDKYFCELSFVSTENFLQGILENLNVSGYLVNKSTKNYQNQAYTLRYAAYKARLVARLLYDNSNIYMDRKYNIYQKFCQYETEFSYVKSSKIGEPWDGNAEVNSEITKGSESL